MIDTDIPDSDLSLRGRADLLVQSVTDYAIYMLDRDGYVVSWNAGAQRFKGYTADEIIGQHFSQFYEEVDRNDKVPQNALKTAELEGRFEAEGWRVRKDGTRFWANVVIDPIRHESGMLLGFAKITRDLTERRRAEEELRRSEERFRLLVEGVTDYAIYMLDPDGRITSWNAGAQRFKGYTADEIMGEHFSRFYTPDEAAAGVPQRALQTARENSHFEAEGWRVRKDGSRFWANVVIDPIRNSEGSLIGYAKITRDLTERRESQLALEATREAFFQSQKMEAIGQLTGGVAHDFNNLLSAIIGSLDLVERRAANGADISKFLQNARLAAERGATLTQRMLAFARKQELKIAAVDLKASVTSMADLFARTLGTGVDVDTDFPDALPFVQADATQLELALLNLIVNARDAMPDGGRIAISARAEESDGPAQPPDHYAVLSVTDQGQGMDPETLRRATEPFFTTKGIGRGTGLGLSMVQGMAEQSGGRLILQSTPGTGTTVELWLKTASVTSQSPAPALVDAGFDRKLDILVVDDDAIILMNTVAMLQDMGHRVHEAPSGQAALDLLGSREVDLLITDYAMPGMCGTELIDAAALLRPEMKSALVSGYADFPEGTKIALHRLAKPYDDCDLRRLIAAVMGVNAPAPDAAPT
ncbi:MAG: PAS domain S-box protein [Novosphingobium sp.]